jgi:hypothetical protein
MTGKGERTLAAWRAEAVAVLARAGRARGLDGLMRVIPFRRLLNVVGQIEVEAAIPRIDHAPTDAEMDALARQAATLAGEYPRLKAQAQAQLPLHPVPIPAPLPIPVPDPALLPVPPKPYGLAHLADPLFLHAHEKTSPRERMRDVASAPAVAQIRERQEKALLAFFSPPPVAPGTEKEAPAWSAHIELGDDLPAAEYRWLSAVGEMKSDPRRVEVAEDELGKVGALLWERLGVRVEGTG